MIIVLIFLISLALFMLYIMWRNAYVYKIRNRWIDEDFDIIRKKNETNITTVLETCKNIRTEKISYEKMVFSLFKFSWPELEIKND